MENMVIKELYLKNFGKFSDCQFLLRDGIQVFYGENEYGKSTIYAFIKAMLFGMERGRGRAAQNDEFSRYEPWENPNYYAGVMRFTSGGKTFRLERSFDRYTKGASLVCEEDGEVLSVEDGDLEMLLGGMTKESFENTIAVGQLLAKPGQGLAEELKNYAANYYETGSSTVDLGGALEILRSRRKSVEQEIKGLLEKQEEKKEVVRQECQYVTNDAQRLTRELQANQEKQDELRLLQKREEAQGNVLDHAEDRAYGRMTGEMGEAGTEADQESAEDQSAGADSNSAVDSNSAADQDKGAGKSCLTIGLLGVAAGIAGRLWSAFISSQGLFSGMNVISVLSWLFLGIGILLMCLGGVKCLRGRTGHRDRQNRHGQNAEIERLKQDKVRAEQEKIRQEQERAAAQRFRQERRQKLATELQKLEWESDRIKAEFKEKQIRFQNLQEQLSELEVPGGKLKSLRSSIEALKLAEEKMLSASRNMVQGFGNILNRKASGILAEITEGRYTKLLADEQLNMTLLEDGRRIPIDRVSCGTIEQVYFALRMAAAEILYEDPLPIIFDDAFAFYDEKRLKSTLKWLSEQQRQVIIFTCQKREQEILSRLV